MKKIVSDIIIVVEVVAAVLILVYAMKDIINSDQTWYNDFAVYCVAVTMTSVLMSVFLYFLRRRNLGKKKIYLSYSEDDKDKAERIEGILPKETTVKSSTYIYPGDNLDEIIPNNISSSNICYVLIGDKISALQKYEISKMRKQNKLIIPILLSEDMKVPQNLRDIKPVTYDAFLRRPYIPYNVN